MAVEMKETLSLCGVPTLLTSSLRVVLGILPSVISDVERLPAGLKDRFIHLMSKRGLVTDDNIHKVVHGRTKILDLSECDVTDVALRRISVCRYLRKIDLNSAKDNRTTITSTGVQALAASCPMLNIVYLRRCTSITDTAIIALATSCRQLVELNIGGCYQITDGSLVALGQNCTMLKCLNVSKTRITDNGIISLAMGVCKKTLAELHMNHCIHLSDEAVEAVVNFCPRLSILLFHGCPCITERSRVALEDISGPQSPMKQVTWTIY